MPDKWTPADLRTIRIALTSLYPTRGDAVRVATDAGLAVTRIDIDGAAENVWASILRFAEARRKVDALLAVAQDENPEVEAIALARAGRTPDEPEGAKVAEWHGSTQPATLEKIMGQRSTLVPISYLERGVIAARAVVRIRRRDGSSGSGFLIDGGRIVTNNHVLPNAEVAAGSTAQFNYQQTVAGADGEIETCALLPDDGFTTSVADDWTAVRVAGTPAERWGTLSLRPAASLAVGDHVNIIQHPGGGGKQISFFANVVVYVGSGRVQYLTDTLPGSSGSPVFDTEWNVVALHHSGGWLSEPNAAAKSTFYRNQGTLIDAVIDGLETPR